jgi:hypothetical protein
MLTLCRAATLVRRRHQTEGVKKLKMANCHPFIFNGLEHAQSPVFEFFHTFATMSAPPAGTVAEALQTDAIGCMLPVSRGCGTETFAPISS